MYVAVASPRRVGYRFLAYSLIAIGAIIFAASGSYLGYFIKAKADLDKETVRLSSEVISGLLPAGWNATQSGIPTGSVTSSGFSIDLPTSFESLPLADQALNTNPLMVDGQVVVEGLTAQSPPNFQDYRYVDWATLPQTVEELPLATRIVIPAIGVDSTIKELGIVMEDGKAVWQRPINTVGHHIGTPNPGSLGNVVLSGHRSSPIRGEGAVFRKLGEVPKLLKQQLEGAGDPIDIFVYTSEKGYVYRAIGSEVLKPEQVDVFKPTPEPTLTLITCTPDLIYSDRLIITAWLIAEVSPI